MKSISTICELCQEPAVCSLAQNSEGEWFQETYTSQLGSISVCASCAAKMQEGEDEFE